MPARILPSWATIGNPREKTRNCRPNFDLLFVYGFLEALPGRERRECLRRDLDFLAVDRASAGARLALARQERAEADYGDPLSLRDVVHDGVEDRIDRLTRGCLAYIAGFGGDLH